MVGEIARIWHRPALGTACLTRRDGRRKILAARVGQVSLGLRSRRAMSTGTRFLRSLEREIFLM